MNTWLDDALFLAISPGQLGQFLARSGWTRLDHPNNRLVVFRGPQNDDSGNAFRIIVPATSEFG